jgi:methylated-DNA-protein-cysteine methyltransferase-like protein
MQAGRSNEAYARIHAVVRRIPRGRVATYGQVAELAGLPGRARQVGYDVPWQRVINAQGRVSPRSAPGFDLTQRWLLEAEGVVFGPDGRVDLERHRWRPRGRARQPSSA